MFFLDNLDFEFFLEKGNVELAPEYSVFSLLSDTGYKLKKITHRCVIYNRLVYSLVRYLMCDYVVTPTENPSQGNVTFVVYYLICSQRSLSGVMEMGSRCPTTGSWSMYQPLAGLLMFIIDCINHLGDLSNTTFESVVVLIYHSQDCNPIMQRYRSHLRE